MHKDILQARFMHVGTTEIDGWDGTSSLWFGFLRRPGRCLEATMTMLVEGHSGGNGLVTDQRVFPEIGFYDRSRTATLESKGGKSGHQLD
jgi:hypothetical protein